LDRSPDGRRDERRPTDRHRDLLRYQRGCKAELARFLAGVATATTIGVTVFFLLGSGIAGKRKEGKDWLDWLIIGLLVFLVIWVFLRRKESQPPKWMSRLQGANARFAVTIGFLLYLLMPTDLVARATVGAYIARQGEPWWHILGFVVLTILIAGLERELERLRREQRVSRSLTLAELVDAYLEQHDVDAVTIEKLRWLLGKAVAVFGERPVGQLRSGDRGLADRPLGGLPVRRHAGAATGARARAVVWGMIDVNPAKLGVDSPSPRRREQRPFESWDELEAVAAHLAPRYRLALPVAEVVQVEVAAPLGKEQQRAVRTRHLPFDRLQRDRLQRHCPHARLRLRALQPTLRERQAHVDDAHLTIDVASLERGPLGWTKPTFATFALRAGISTFDLSRYMGASLTMIDRHYGHWLEDRVR
jgi:integrase